MPPASVTAPISYVGSVPDNEKAYHLMYGDTTDLPRTNIEHVWHDTIFQDVRARQPAFNFAHSGLAIRTLNTSMLYADFHDERKIREVYFKELEHHLQDFLNAKEVRFFRYGIRKRHVTFPVSSGQEYDFAQPTVIAHVDATSTSTWDEMLRQFGHRPGALHPARFQWVNVWKPLRGPVNDWPLCFCDPATIDVQDMETTDMVYPDYFTENLSLRFNSAQKWYYLSDHQPDEIIIFKQSDSDPSAVGGVPHCSFANPKASCDELPRNLIANTWHVLRRQNAPKSRQASIQTALHWSLVCSSSAIHHKAGSGEGTPHSRQGTHVGRGDNRDERLLLLRGGRRPAEDGNATVETWAFVPHADPPNAFPFLICLFAFVYFMADDHFTEHPLQYGVDGGIYFEVGSLEFVAFPGHKYGWLPIETTRQPLTVIPTDPGCPLTKAAFLKLINDIEHRDDVSQAPFRQLLLFWATRQGKIRLPQSLKSHLAEQNVEYVVVELQDAGRALSAGPYLWYDGRLGPIYRLYEDSHSTFIGSLRPGDEDLPLKPFRLAGHDSQTLCVPVPSRQPLLGNSLDHGRLTGKRILIKDIFDVRGLKMSACSRAFLRLATPSKRTAPAIQRLLDEGAAIVGTAKLSSMISREEPSECIDFCAPFNPRGDRSQSPAGSSSGSAAAIAAYDWLDYAIGSDSTGSTRRPAGVNGCFAIRLSTTALPAEGILPCFKLFDAPSLFCRDVNGMADFVQAWCGNSLESSARSAPVVIINSQ
ncbi:hypothetical protein AC578_982 [Pseudocercospora eumusae]|uniref:Amidase domain-containing protein n=1 Tax=Pseudocercospora eumusae TaxID=321146 RepID=A0A139HEE2_9PEZI|nr:hypothetical protein AC578_982 [Pseudocercospora eumusae]